jgi:hypothetical protein
MNDQVIVEGILFSLETVPKDALDLTRNDELRLKVQRGQMLEEAVTDFRNIILGMKGNVRLFYRGKLLEIRIPHNLLLQFKDSLAHGIGFPRFDKVVQSSQLSPKRLIQHRR